MQNAVKTKNSSFQLVCSAVPLKEFEWDANTNHIMQKVMNNLLLLVFKVWSPAKHLGNKHDNVENSKHVRSAATGIYKERHLKAMQHNVIPM